MTQPEGEAMFPIPAVYLIHGKGESPRGDCEETSSRARTALARIEFRSPRHTFL
jgi:hypothetical protein